MDDSDDSATSSKRSRFDSVTTDHSTSRSESCPSSSVDPESDQENSSNSLHTIENDDNDYVGVPFSYADPLRMSAVILAVLGKNWEKLKEAVVQGKDLNATLDDGNTALHYAISYGYVDMLKYLLKQPGIQTDVMNHQGFGLMAWTVKNYKCQAVEIISILLEAGCSVNNEDDRVSTLIEVIDSEHMPIRKKNEIALQLLEANVDINKRNIYKQSALHLTIMILADLDGFVPTLEPYLNLFHMLLYYNADVLTVDFNFESPYTFAKTNCDPEIADALFDYIADFNYAEVSRPADRGYYSILMNAIEFRCDKVFTIIERGGDVNAYGHKCASDSCEVAVKTCLSLACQTDPAVFQIIWDNCDKNFLFEMQPDFIQIYVEKSIFTATTFLYYFYKLLEYEKTVDIFQDFRVCNLIFKQMVDKMHSFKLDRNERMKIIFSLLNINTHCLDYELLLTIYARFGFDEELEAIMKICESPVRGKTMLVPIRNQYVRLIFRPKVTRRWCKAHKMYPRNFRKGIKRTLVQLSRDIIRENLQPASLCNERINFKYYLNLLKSNIPTYLIDIITLKKEIYPHENEIKLIPH